ncbi:MAG: hypothetical protein IKJ07_00180 [Clostridia bacterium]|nr:hypothetical protein [Clostridia bacterium]
MFVFRKARNPTKTLNDLDAYLNSQSTEPIKWLAREVQSWNEFSYAELEAAILDGRLEDIIDWQARYAAAINATLAPQWSAAIEAASKKASRGKVILSDTNDWVKAWLTAHGAELATKLSDESKKAIANVLLKWQGELLRPREMAYQIRPLIGLNERQAIANANYRAKLYRSMIDNGVNPKVAAERADNAATRYASKQHRYRAETIVNTELAFAYNQGAHEGVTRSIAGNYMNHCEMVWTTAGTNRVCSRCLELKDTVVGRTDESGVTLPPLHPRCRCAIMYRELKEQPKPKVYREFKDAEEANDYFGKKKTDKSKPFGAWYSSTRKNYREAVIKYTSNYYEEMNGWLRGLMPEADFTAEELETLKQVILDCETALAKSELPDNILVHRQAGYGMLDLYKKAPNGIFHDEGFTSTTPVKGSFSGSIDIEIKVPAGKGAGMWVDPISEYKGENEFLLNRGTKFKVVEIDESGKRPLVKLEVIGRDAKEVTKMLKRKENAARQVRSDKFTWTPADVKVQDKDGKWIRGDEFLNSLKAKPEKK